MPILKLTTFEVSAFLLFRAKVHPHWPALEVPCKRKPNFLSQHVVPEDPQSADGDRHCFLVILVRD